MKPHLPARLLAGAVALAALAMAASSAQAATQVSPFVVGYGGVEIANGNVTECVSATETPGGTEANPNAGVAYSCAAFSTSHQNCVPAGEGSTCNVHLKAVVKDPGGWRFDHWSGACATTSLNCSFRSQETLCDPDNKPPCETIELGPFTVRAHFVDTRAPVVGLLQAPAENSVIFSDTPTQQFFFNTNESQEAPDFGCERDGPGLFDPCLSGYVWTPIADGVHRFCVRARDVSGLSGQPLCRTWQQERNPTAEILTHPPATEAGPAAAFTYSSNKTDHAADGSSLSYLCQLDGAGLEPCPADGVSYGSVKPGAHRFDVQAVFQAALEPVGTVHSSPLASFDWTVAATCETDPSLCPPPTCETDPSLCPPPPSCATNPALCPPPPVGGGGGGGTAPIVIVPGVGGGQTGAPVVKALKCKKGFKKKKVRVKVKIKGKVKFKKKLRCVKVKKAKKKKPRR